MSSRVIYPYQYDPRRSQIYALNEVAQQALSGWNSPASLPVCGISSTTTGWRCLASGRGGGPLTAQVFCREPSFNAPIDRLTASTGSKSNGPNCQGDGVAAFKLDLAELTKHRSIDVIKLVLGQGDFVFIVAKGSHEGAPCVYIDLYRVEDGKIAERWGIPQEIAPQEEWKNNKGML
jgi:predicted SnoaL-like aldol condensation-catalyzing enzyme